MSLGASRWGGESRGVLAIAIVGVLVGGGWSVAAYAAGHSEASGRALTSIATPPTPAQPVSSAQARLPSGPEGGWITSSALRSASQSVVVRSGPQARLPLGVRALFARPTSVTSGSGANNDGSAPPEMLRTSTHVTEYLVTFRGCGGWIPNGTWYVNITGTVSLSGNSSSSLSVQLPNGSYNYSVGTSNRTFAAPGGVLVVNGAPGVVTVDFQLWLYNLNLNITGLPNSSEFQFFEWGGVPNNTDSQWYSDSLCYRWCGGNSSWDSEPNGTAINYSLDPPAGFQLRGSPQAGTVVINGSDLNLAFQIVRGPTYHVDFIEEGLARYSTFWCVQFLWIACTFLHDLNHETDWPSGGVLNLTPGPFPYSILPSPNQTITAKLRGSPIPLVGVLNLTRTETIRLKYVYPYLVYFNESGLPPGGNWSIVLHGETAVNHTGGTIVFGLPNGTYSYRVGRESGYSYSEFPARLKVNGNNTSVLVTFKLKDLHASTLSSVMVGMLALAPLTVGPRFTRRGHA
jgi:hypothetical protein